MEENMTYGTGYNKKPFYYWLLVYLVIGGLVYGVIYYVYFAGKGGYSPATSYTSPTPVISTPSSPSPEVKGQVIILSDAGYAPTSLTIAVGDTVTWTNNGTKPATVNSDPHPSHQDYPPLNLGMMKPGASVSLKFDTAGTYGYHNHLNSSQRGTIIVK